MMNKSMTVGQLKEKLSGIEGSDELPVKISNYEGDHGMSAYTIRKHVISNDEGEIVDAYIVING